SLPGFYLIPPRGYPVSKCGTLPRAIVAGLREIGMADVVHRRGRLRSVAMVALRLAETLGDLDDSTLHAAEHARRREAPRGVALARGHTCEHLDPLRDGLDRVEVELVVGDGARDVLAQDEVLEVRAREHDA